MIILVWFFSLFTVFRFCFCFDLDSFRNLLDFLEIMSVKTVESRGYKNIVKFVLDILCVMCTLHTCRISRSIRIMFKGFPLEMKIFFSSL